jgi:ABC-2 type transport system permease protein
LVNLILNENMKIYRRARTWIMIGLLILILIAGISIIWFDSGRQLQNEEWRTSLEQQISNYESLLDDPNMDANFIEYAKKDIAFLQYELDHNIRPINATMWGPIVNMSGLVTLITLFIVIVAGDSIAGEFSTGTIKMLLIRPASRTKILLSKYAACLLFGIFLLLILFVCSLLISGIYYGFSGFNQPFIAAADDGSIVEKNMMMHIWGIYLAGTVSTVMYVTMSFMISAVFRSSAMAIGISMFAMMSGSIITLLLSRYEWSKYLLFANLDLMQYSTGQPFKEGMTLGFSIAVLLVYFAIFNLLSWLVFTKKDVTA